MRREEERRGGKRRGKERRGEKRRGEKRGEWDRREWERREWERREWERRGELTLRRCVVVPWKGRSSRKYNAPRRSNDAWKNQRATLERLLALLYTCQICTICFFLLFLRDPPSNPNLSKSRGVPDFPRNRSTQGHGRGIFCLTPTGARLLASDYARFERAKNHEKHM